MNLTLSNARGRVYSALSEISFLIERKYGTCIFYISVSPTVACELLMVREKFGANVIKKFFFSEIQGRVIVKKKVIYSLHFTKKLGYILISS